MNDNSIVVDHDTALRAVCSEDASDLLELIKANKEHLRPYLNWVDDINNMSDIQAFIDNQLKETYRQKGLSWCIIYRDRIIGSVLLYDWTHRVNKISMGYWIDKDHEGLFIVSKCIEQLLNFVFYEMGINKVELYFSPQNTRSQKVAERFHFRLEGLIRSTFYINGRIEDQYLAGLLQHEWLSLNR